MDTSSPAVFVNGGLLRLHVGRKVRAVVQVMRSDVGFFTGKSTDERQLIIKGSPPVPPTNYVEVIGVAENDNSIRAEIWTNFGDSLGMPFYSIIFYFECNALKCYVDMEFYCGVKANNSSSMLCFLGLGECHI